MSFHLGPSKKGINNDIKVNEQAAPIPSAPWDQLSFYLLSFDSQ